MTHLISTALAVFAVWEYLRVLLPVDIPAWLQPALVAGFAVIAEHLPHRAVAVLAVTGAVALFHAAVATSHPPMLVRRRPASRVPRI